MLFIKYTSICFIFIIGLFLILGRIIACLDKDNLILDSWLDRLREFGENFYWLRVFFYINTIIYIGFFLK